jgi:hypothetical protein
MENNIPVFSLEKVDDKATTIPFELLCRSIRQEGKFGKTLDTKPVQVWSLIRNIQGMIEQGEKNYQMEDLYIQKRSSAAYLNDEDRNAGFSKFNAPINRWKFDKVIGAINLPNISSPGVNAKIAVTLNDLGLMIAFGMNVHVCNNFSVLGGTVLRTFTYNGQPGLSWELVEHRLRGWINSLQQLFSVQSEIMNGMINTPVRDERTIQKIVGILYQKAIEQAYFRGDPTPFDTHGLSQFVQEMIKQRKEEEKLGNVWDLYNWGTSIMKPGIIDIGDIANVSNLYADFLLQEFKISAPSIEDAVIIE